jgi:sugar O-acyltransferase (sialic acid O-acetyltransferase NeuD family)
VNGADRPAPDDAPELLIFPCNGNAIEALDCVSVAYRLIGFVDDTLEKQASTVYGHSVHPRSALKQCPNARVLAVPGSPQSYLGRRALIEGLGVRSGRWARVIHPTARISPLATIGNNVLLMAGVVVTSNAVIGSHVVVLPNTVIHHDTRIGDWSLIGSNVTVAGNTSIGDNCYIASGTTIMDGLTIGAGTLIGLGSTVIRSAPAGSRMAGNPARPV